MEKRARVSDQLQPMVMFLGENIPGRGNNQYKGGDMRAVITPSWNGKTIAL